jgi:signal transduction histidine kinase
LPSAAREWLTDGAIALVAFGVAVGLLMHGLGNSGAVKHHLDAWGLLLAASRDARRPWTRRITEIVVAVFCVHMLAFALGHNQVPEVQLSFGALVWGLAWFAGERTRLRRQHLADLEHRAIRAEREADQDRRLAVAEERTRIARDLHDSAAHAINVIAVQAGAARLWQEHDPARSREALETIEGVAHRTVAEIDQIVHALRDEETSSAQRRG